MKRACKYRFYSTPEQVELLAQTFDCVRFVYNSVLRWSRPLPSAPSTVTISKDAAGRYFVSCLCEFEPALLPITAKTVGIDVGLIHLFVTDNGFRQSNPRHTVKYEKRLALLQRQLSRKKKGSKNRAKARLKVARLHAKIADCRLDALYKATRRLINENQVVCVESLKVKTCSETLSCLKRLLTQTGANLCTSLSIRLNGPGVQ